MRKIFCIGILLASTCGMAVNAKKPAIDTDFDPTKKSLPQRMLSRVEDAPDFQLPKFISAYSMDLGTKGCVGKTQAFLVIDKCGVAKLKFVDSALSSLDKKSTALAFGETHGPENENGTSFWTHHF